MECAATRAGTNAVNTVHKALYDTRWPVSWLQRGCKLPCRFAELRAMLLVKRVARAQGPCEFGKDLRQQTIMKVDDRLTPILTRSYKSDGDAVAVGVGVKLRVPAKTAD